jgi:hypothetical protein
MKLLRPRAWHVWVFLASAILSVVGWYCTAYPRGAATALLDFATGQYEIQTYGYPAPQRWIYADLLRDRYRVRLRPVAGCEVSPNEEWYVSGYNSVSGPLIIKRFRKDVFAECWADARDEWETRQAAKEQNSQTD